MTDRRVIAWWRMLADPVVVQAPLGDLLPPVVVQRSLMMALARPATRERNGWKNLAWPATTIGPPALIGIEECERVRDLICAAQISARAGQRAG